MLTDDDLTRELRRTFDRACDGLTYTGITPTARRTPSTAWVTVPVVAATAVVAVTTTTGPPPADEDIPSATTTSTPTSSPAVVTADFEVAGHTVRYRGPAPAPAADLRWETDVTRPTEAEQVDAGELGDVADGVKAWVGTDPDSGDNALYLVSPIRNGGHVSAVMSATWSVQQLKRLVFTAGPS